MYCNSCRSLTKLFIHFVRFCHHVVDKGPTLLIVQDASAAVFGGFAAQSWRKPGATTAFYGSGADSTTHLTCQFTCEFGLTFDDAAIRHIDFCSVILHIDFCSV